MFYSFGINQYNIDCKNKTIHAEVDALLKLKYQDTPTKIDILIFRTNKKGIKLMNAKPCCNCINQIKRFFKNKNYRTNRIYYTGDDEKIHFLKMSEL